MSADPRDDWSQRGHRRTDPPRPAKAFGNAMMAAMTATALLYTVVAPKTAAGKALILLIVPVTALGVLVWHAGYAAARRRDRTHIRELERRLEATERSGFEWDRGNPAAHRVTAARRRDMYG